MPDTRPPSNAAVAAVLGSASADDWAVVVGIKDYGDPDLNTLKAPTSDAEAFLAWLRSPTGGDIAQPGVGDAAALSGDGDAVREAPPDRIKVIRTNGPQRSVTAARPTYGDIEEKVYEIQDWLQVNGKRGRRLYLYMSGHGCTPVTPELSENAALLMANAQIPRRSHQNFPATSCAVAMRRAGLFEEVVLIMDCCRSKQSGTGSPQPYNIEGETTKSGRLIEAYATNWDSEAHEFAFPPDPDLKGVFTRALLACLNSGRLTGSQLKESVRAHVLHDLIANEIPEDEVGHKLPRLKSDPDGDLSRIVLSENAAVSRTEVRILRRGAIQEPKMFDCRGRWPSLVEPSCRPEGAGGDGEFWSWSLEPGAYRYTVGEVGNDLDVHAALPLALDPADGYAATVIRAGGARAVQRGAVK